MKTRTAVALAAASLYLAPTLAVAGVNCAQVKKYLSTGRTPEDVSDTMVVDLAEVKKCAAEEEAASGEKKADAPATADEKK